MAANPKLITKVGADQILKIPAKGQPASDFVIPVVFGFLEAGGRYIFSRLQIFYTIATGGAASGSSTVVVAETIDSQTPPQASIFLFDGTSFDEYTYTALNTDTRTFTLDATAHPSGLTKAYADGNEAKLESEATVDIDCRDATFEYAPGGANNQIIVRAEGSEVNLTIPASLPSSDYSQVTDTAEIFFQTNAGAFFTPAELAGLTIEFRADSIYWDDSAGSGIWTSVDGDYRLQKGNFSSSNFTGVFGAQNYIETGFRSGWILRKYNSALDAWELHDVQNYGAAIAICSVGSELDFLARENAVGDNILEGTNSGIRIISNNKGDVNFNWNGKYVSGALIKDLDSSNYNHDGSSWVANEIFVLSALDMNGMTGPLSVLNGRADFENNGYYNASSGNRWVGLIFVADAIGAADEEKLIRYAGFIAADRGHTNPISSTLPDYNVRPLGGTSAVLDLAVPATSVTFSNIPEVGTDLYIYDAADNNELTSLTSTLATHELAYSANGSQIRVQIVFPAGTFLEINLTLAVGNIPIDVGAIAINERNFLNPS